MSKRVEQPVTVPRKFTSASDATSTETTHPAFGQISASRVHGHAFLYGSDFLHNGYMTIRVHRSKQMRDTSHDWYFPREELIEVSLTEAQWATFVSTPNAGSGTPCTINHLRGEEVPDLPPPPARTEQIAFEASHHADAAVASLVALREEIGKATMSEKQRKHLLGYVDSAHRGLSGSIPWMLKAFAEQTEAVIERAKVEVNAYATRTIVRMGLEKLLGSDHVLLRLHTKGESEEPPV